MVERLTVAVPTFHRNADLRELLPEILVQVAALRDREGMQARVLLVDNDPAGGAREVAEEFAPTDVVYVHEPVAGLAAVRQRALDESASWDLLAFMDDDGRPAPGWIDTLVRTWQASRPAAVAGRVVEHYLATPSSWIVAGDFFRRRSLATGTEVQAAPAGNLLIDLDQVRGLGLAFDPRFGLSGGEDTLFTRQLTRAGGRIVWCEESQVTDLVPADRMRPRWVLRRAWSHGNTASLVDQALAGPGRGRLVARLRGVAGGVVRLTGGGARYGLGVVVGSERHRAKGLRAAARGLGMVYGSLGHVYQEYSR